MSGIKTMFCSVLLASSMAAPALASHCPMDAKAIETGLANMEVGEDTRSKVVQLHDEGLAAHNAGNHSEAEHKLAEAMRMLLNSTAM